MLRTKNRERETAQESDKTSGSTKGRLSLNKTLGEPCPVTFHQKSFDIARTVRENRLALLYGKSGSSLVALSA